MSAFGITVSDAVNSASMVLPLNWEFARVEELLKSTHDWDGDFLKTVSLLHHHSVGASEYDRKAFVWSSLAGARAPSLQYNFMRSLSPAPREWLCWCLGTTWGPMVTYLRDVTQSRVGSHVESNLFSIFVPCFICSKAGCFFARDTQLLSCLGEEEIITSGGEVSLSLKWYIGAKGGWQ